MDEQTTIMHNKIPQIIHQIWIGPNEQPFRWTDTFKKDYMNMFPDYKYMLWTEKTIKNNNLFEGFELYEQVYNIEGSWNGKSDILRYIILYKYGGLYIDADSVWINNKNFDELIDKVNDSGVFVSTHTENNQMCGGVMGSTPHNLLILELIKGIENMVKRTWRDDKIFLGWYKKKRSYQGAYKLIGPCYIDRILKDKNITIFPSIYFYPISWHGVDCIDKHTLMDMPHESFTFQYGYTTNNLKEQFKE